MKQIAALQLNELIKNSQSSPRRRANLNLHDTLDEPIQRLAIAMQPDTLIRPHRHPHTWELLLPLSGRFVVLYFDDAGIVTNRLALGEDVFVLETPAGQWHSVLSLDDGGVIFEVKHGPYTPIADVDFAQWAPEGDAAQAAALRNWYGLAKTGDRFI